MRAILGAAAWLAAGLLLAFSLRRAVLLAAALVAAWRPRGRQRASAQAQWRGPEGDGVDGQRPSPPPPAQRARCLPGGERGDVSIADWRLPITVLIPCRNEAASLPGLLRAIDRLDYPRDQLHVVVVNDGSTDASAQVAADWAAGRPGARLVSLPQNVGKAQALNQALSEGAQEGAIAIYDADHSPAPDALQVLAKVLAEEAEVGAVSGQMRVANGAASPAAFYAAVESLVNQLITMRAKDWLDLAPALLGSNCLYRRAALAGVNGFRPGALLEDTDLTLALAQAGWRTRFVPQSVSDHDAPVSLAGYVRQHLRWNRGFHQVGGGRLGALWRDRRLPLRLKVELTFFALGYADRLALLAGALFTVVDRFRPGSFGFPTWVWLVYVGLPALEMLAALRLARQPAGMYLRLVVVPFFFGLDVAVAAWSAVQSGLRRPARWLATERAGQAEPRQAANVESTRQ